jgi:hypothetical protein
MKSAPEPGPRQYVAAGYLIAAVFAITYVSLLAFGGRLHPALATVTSASLLAVVLAAPLVLPVVVRHVLPRMTGIKISDIVEISLAEVSSSSGPSLNAMVDQLAISAKQASAPEYANMMSSQSAMIVETVRNLGVVGSDVLIVDLRRGDAWIPPNLYLLALLVQRRTGVQQVVFVETGVVEEIFVCACEPRELVGALTAAYPVLASAANHAESAVVKGGQDHFAQNYFQQLLKVYQQSPDAAATKEIWLSSATLIPLLGGFANRTAVEWKKTVDADTGRVIVNSPSRFVAAVRQGQLIAVLHRDRVALEIARGLLVKAG